MRILLAALLMVAALGLLLAMVAGAVEPSLGSALAAYAGMLAGMVLAAAEAMARWG